jgi:hypothetical protein
LLDPVRRTRVKMHPYSLAPMAVPTDALARRMIAVE